jgi:putative AlgH/UPF0301 family transcriptional regulator
MLTALDKKIYRTLFRFCLKLDAFPVLRTFLGPLRSHENFKNDTQTLKNTRNLVENFCGHHQYYIPSLEKKSALAILRSMYRSPLDSSKSIDSLALLRHFQERFHWAKSCTELPVFSSSHSIPQLLKLRSDNFSHAFNESRAIESGSTSFISRIISSEKVLQKNLTGKLLLSHPLLGYPFSRSVILILEHVETKGAVGIVLNCNTKRVKSFFQVIDEFVESNLKRKVSKLTRIPMNRISTISEISNNQSNFHEHPFSMNKRQQKKLGYLVGIHDHSTSDNSNLLKGSILKRFGTNQAYNGGPVDGTALFLTRLSTPNSSIEEAIHGTSFSSFTQMEDMEDDLTSESDFSKQQTRKKNEINSIKHQFFPIIIPSSSTSTTPSENDCIFVGRKAISSKLMDKTTPDEVLFFLNSCRWSPGQLESEISSGVWIVGEVGSASAMWKDIILPINKMQLEKIEKEELQAEVGTSHEHATSMSNTNAMNDDDSCTSNAWNYLIDEMSGGNEEYKCWKEIPPSLIDKLPNPLNSYLF